MAQQKWIKWIVGLSGVALFSGFVGLISAHGESAADKTAGQTDGTIAQSGGDDVTDQWQSQSDSGSGGGVGSRGGRGGLSDNGGSGGLGGDSGGQSEFGGQGSMRTHAS